MTIKRERLLFRQLGLTFPIIYYKRFKDIVDKRVVYVCKGSKGVQRYPSI